jgi:hypothetical protein
MVTPATEAKTCALPESTTVCQSGESFFTVMPLAESALKNFVRDCRVGTHALFLETHFFCRSAKLVDADRRELSRICTAKTVCCDCTVSRTVFRDSGNLNVVFPTVRFASEEACSGKMELRVAMAMVWFSVSGVAKVASYKAVSQPTGAGPEQKGRREQSQIGRQ